MQPRELVLKILRLNLIPAPRVVAPGPATRFPVLHVDTNGSERVVRTLFEARALSKKVAGSLRDQSAGDFFIDVLPVEQTAEVIVSDLAGELTVASCGTTGPLREAAISLAVRAAYALGLNRALVTVVMGPGGPWVVDVEPQGLSLETAWRSEEVSRREASIRLLGAKAEYIAVDPRSGRALGRFFEVCLTPEGELAVPFGGQPAPLGTGPTPPDDYLWLSSPVPRRGMPLSTRFVFEGVPTSEFLWALDRSAAVLGMMSCRAEDVRERNGTGEGLLGSYRLAGEGVFEYTAVPSLLWNPRAMKRLCEAVSRVVQRYNKGLTKPELWESHLQGVYRWQRAYYHADKAFFLRLSGTEAVDTEAPEYPPEGDFRPCWRLDAPVFDEPCVTVGSGIAFAGQEPREHHVAVKAGGRSVSVKWENVLGPDAVEADDFNGGVSARAPATLVRPNPTAARMLALPEEAILRANVTSGGSGIRIGPVIGIMAPELSKGQKFGIETDRFRHLVRLGAEMGLLVYVFFPEVPPDEEPVLDPVSGLVKGWTYRDRRGWSEGRLPVPDVVYDRYIPGVAGGARDVAQVFAGACPEAVFLNSLPFVGACRDKLKTHQILTAIPEVASHLPYTEPVTEPSRAARFASSRHRSFLKLRYGTGTKGLALIENLGSRYRITRREKGTPPRVDEVQGEAGLLRFLGDILRGASPGAQGGLEAEPEFIIQEGIDLATLPGGAGSAFEVRVVYQKGGAGLWMRTGMVVRANPEAESFVVPGVELHYRAGDILEMALPGRANEVKAEIRRVARMIPPALERHSGRGGEISVDFGIDKKGKPWLIEVNSKPATLFRNIGAFRLRKLTLLRVLNYAIFLHRELHS